MDPELGQDRYERDSGNYHHRRSVEDVGEGGDALADLDVGLALHLLADRNADKGRKQALDQSYGDEGKDENEEDAPATPQDIPDRGVSVEIEGKERLENQRPPGEKPR